MGRYQGDKYFRGHDDGALQWLEDGVGLMFTILFSSIVLLVSAIFGILSGLFCLLTGQNSD